MVASYKKQLTSLSICLVLMVSILAPSIIKVQHALFEHYQEECIEQGTVHLHKVELDCDFQKHQISAQHYPPLFAHTFRTSIPEKEKKGHYYVYVSEGTNLYFSLRAPPVA